MSDLAEAIAFYNNAEPVSPDGPFEVIFDAARRVLEAEQVQWCVEHKDPFWRTVLADKIQSCRVGWDAGEWDFCSIIPVRIIREGVGDE